MSDSQKKTVIVIGAGIAGLTAAQKLEEKEYNVILLEARQEVGGRVRLSHDIPLGPLYLHEIGAYQGKSSIDGFIKAHPNYLLTATDLPSSQPIPALLHRLGISSKQVWHEDFEQSIIVVGEKAGVFDWPKFNNIYMNYRSEKENYYPNFPGDNSNSLEEHCAQFLATTFSEAYSGLPIKEFQTIMQNSQKNDLVFFEYENVHHIVEGAGYYTLVNHIKNNFKKIKTYYDSFVSKIEQLNKQVLVNTVNGDQYKGDAVIVTVPLGVLQKNMVQILGLSDNKKMSIQNLKMGIMNTVTLKYKTQFWSKESISLIVLNTNPNARPVTVFLNANKILENSTPTLISSFFADDGLRDSNDLIKDAKNIIKQVWPNAPDPIFEEVTAWQHDLYTYGSWASFSVDTKDKDIVNLMSPEWEGRLVFAGDAVVPIGLMGSFHGAYISSLRAARLIDEYLRSSVS